MIIPVTLEQPLQKLSYRLEDVTQAALDTFPDAVQEPLNKAFITGIRRLLSRQSPGEFIFLQSFLDRLVQCPGTRRRIRRW